MTEEVWRERDTTPSTIEAALRDLLIERYHDEDAFVPARVLNLVVVVDGEFRGEIENRLERVGPLPPVAARDLRRRGGAQDDRRVGAASPPRRADGRVLARPRAGRDRHRRAPPEGARHDRRPAAGPRPGDRGVGAARARRGGRRAAPAGAGRAASTRRTSPTSAAALARAGELLEHAYVVDLAWLRSTPWRERVAAAFDPPQLRRGLRRDLAGHGPPPRRTRSRPRCCSAAGCASRLGWRPGSFAEGGGSAARRARARAPRRGRRCASSEVEQPGAPGLRGRHDRDGLGPLGVARPRPGGLEAVRRARDGKEQRVDGAGRLARRGGHPRRGRPPGAAARSDVQAGAVGGA